MKKTKTLWLAQLSLLIAIELILAYTPLGYLRTLGLEITFLMIPVAVGAIVLGPGAGAVLGLVFGLTSFGTCFGSSAFGSSLLAINPIGTFITCAGARVLAGWLAGFIFSKIKKFKYSIEITSLIAPLLNTVFFMGCLVIFFYNTDYIQSFADVLGAANPITFVIMFVGVQGLVEAAVGFIATGLISKGIYKTVNK